MIYHGVELKCLNVSCAGEDFDYETFLYCEKCGQEYFVFYDSVDASRRLRKVPGT